MIVRNKIWEELLQAQTNVLYVRYYTDINRKCNRLIYFIVAVIATMGTLGYIFYNFMPLISSLIIAFGSLVKALFPHVTQPERELCELDNLMEFYNKYNLHLERLLDELDKKKKPEEDVLMDFYKEKELECEKQSALNKYIRTICKKKNEEIKKEIMEYYKRVYENKYE